MAVLSSLALHGNPAAVLQRGGEEGAVLARAAVALLRAAVPAGACDDVQRLGLSTLAPCSILLKLLKSAGAPAAAPALALLLSNIDAAAGALAGAAAAAACALRAEAADLDLEADGLGMLVYYPMHGLELLFNAATAATGTTRPQMSAATARTVVRAAAAAIALLPPGAHSRHWAGPGAAAAYRFLVSTPAS